MYVCTSFTPMVHIFSPVLKNCFCYQNSNNNANIHESNILQGNIVEYRLVPRDMVLNPKPAICSFGQLTFPLCAPVFSCKVERIIAPPHQVVSRLKQLI